MTIQPTDEELEKSANDFINANQEKGQAFYFSSELPYFLNEGTEYDPLIALLRNAWNQGATAAKERAMTAVLEPLGEGCSTESELLLRRAWDRVRLS